MTGQETVLTKKRGPKPTGQGTLIGVRAQPNLLEQLDAWRAAQPAPAPSRPEAVRRLLAGAFEPRQGGREADKL